VAALVDTNVLVYRFDPQYPDKQRIATRLLRQRLERDDVRIPHQAIVEFVAAATRPRKTAPALMSTTDAWREAEKFLMNFEVLYPTDAVVRTAIRGAAVYQLPWFDAHLWAYAEHFGCNELLSEDFQHGRMYGAVRAINPFV
jgi:predicted nucleic acid-binding protein